MPMARIMTWQEAGGILAVIVVLVGLPLLLWHWQVSMLPHRYPPNTKIFTLTAVAQGGIWTQESVMGTNYWWRTPARAEDIPLNQGDHVVLRLRSADVLHSFALPILRRGPVDVPAGHTVELEFDADRAGSLMFLCMQVCGRDHGKLQGHFVAKATAGAESW
jgi:heme/copper-type cytochrome/quinol oxidase subunit 2